MVEVYRSLLAEFVGWSLVFQISGFSREEVRGTEGTMQVLESWDVNASVGLTSDLQNGSIWRKREVKIMTHSRVAQYRMADVLSYAVTRD